MKKGKVIVPLALCVCVVLIVIGIALGNNPIRSSVGQSQSAEMNSSEESKASESSDAAESTESASSSSEDPNAGLTSEQIMMGELILTGVTLCPMFHYTVRLSGIYVLAAPFCAVLSVSLIGQFITMLESCAAVNGVQSMKDISTVPVGETAKIVFPVAVSERMLPSSKCGEEAIRAAEYRLILTNYPERQEIVLSS